MKKLFIFLILLNSYYSYAQNYQCLQSGVKQYFVNSNGYLRGIRIDSVSARGDTIVYYPNHTPRGPYTTTGAVASLDPNGGSWLGKKVLQKIDGTFIFDSYWNDSVILKTKVNIGDSWVFYKDVSSLYYKATLIAKDTMSVLSVLDSVQTILINACNGSGIVTTDPLNGFKIILSKDHGFVQVMDLYTFPYHKADSVYRPGLDFYLDRSTCNYINISSIGGFAPADSVSIFTRTGFINPNDQQLHNWNVNDIIGSSHTFTEYPYTGSFSYSDYLSDTVSNKLVSVHAVNYTFTGNAYSCSNISDPCELVTRPVMYTFYDTVYSIADNFFMPEEGIHAPNYIFYFPADTSQCILAPEYVITPVYYSIAGPNPLRHSIYKLNIGETYNQYATANHLLLEWNSTTYTYINGVSCSPSGPGVINKNAAINNLVTLYPNPVCNELTIEAMENITSLTIANLLGQTLYSQQYNSLKVQLNVADFPAGIYFLKVNGTGVRKFIKE